MPKQFKWAQLLGTSGLRAEAPGNVTLFVAPDHVVGFAGKPARGTTWRAGVTHWDEATRTASRYGRDCYGTAHKTAKDAMRAAEAVYLEAQL